MNTKLKAAEMLPTSKIELNQGQIQGVPKNPRFIRDNRFEKLKQSITDAPEMLEMRSLIVVAHGKKYVAICGNMRLRACLELGYKELPCYILPEGTPAAKLREYTIKDNIGYGENDWDILANDWDMTELEDWGLELQDWGVNPDDYGEEFNLPDGEKNGLRQITFLFAEEQASFIEDCIEKARTGKGETETYGNDNAKGNALYKIVKEWAGRKR